MATRASRVKIVVLAAMASVALLTIGSTSAKADTYTYTLNTVFNGDAPTSTGPWLTASFTDIAGGVQLTLTSSLSVGSEYIQAFAFNINPSIEPSTVKWTTDSSNPIQSSVGNNAQNAQQLGGLAGSGFDFLIAWPTANNDGGVKRFNGTDVDTFVFTLNGLTAADFNYLSMGTANAHVAAKVAGISGSLSGDIKDGPVAVPEPELIALLGIGLGAVALFKRRWLS
jgi:hypothetical protein